MTLSKILNITALLISFLATFYWIKGATQITPKIISELSVTKWGYNSDIIESLSAQKADSIIAFSLLGLAFVLQMVAQFLYDSSGSYSKRLVIIFSLILATGIFVTTHIIRNLIFENTTLVVKSIIEEKIRDTK